MYMYTRLCLFVKDFSATMTRIVLLVAFVGIISFGTSAIMPVSVAHANFFNISTGSNGTSVSGCQNLSNGGSVNGGSNGTNWWTGFTSQGSCNGAIGYANLIVGIINNILTPLVFAIAFIVFLWGMFKYFIAGGANPEEQAKGWKLLMYSLIGFAVMISIWGLVNIILHTFNLGTTTAPRYPQI